MRIISASKKEDGLYFIETRRYGRQMWYYVKVRKTHECVVCHNAISSKTLMLRPLPNLNNKTHRICIRCADHAVALTSYGDHFSEQSDALKYNCLKFLTGQCKGVSGEYQTKCWDAYAFFYCLVDPFTYEVCYVGLTQSPEMRYKQHCSVKDGMLYQSNIQLSAWLWSLDKKEQRPRFLILRCSNQSKNHREENKIVKRMWYQGHPLLNASLNGGVRDRERRQEWVDRLTQAKWNLQRGKPLSPSDSYYPDISVI